ncbi:MAG TPA: helix-turn-helix domain-containing protein [Ktedonobacterales bacterium]|jgi:putative transposase|nr:helix-turn-helix domain-containing protein [Ktedonobacterales bacterium]
MLMRAFQYRLYPTKEQQRLLDRHLEEYRWLRHSLLAERKQAWEQRQQTVDYSAQKAALPGLQATDRPTLQAVHFQGLHDVVLRLKQAFDALFRRLKAGETPGETRFRGRGRYDRLPFPRVPTMGCAPDAPETRLIVSKVGRIKVLLQSSCSARWRARPTPPRANGW